MNGLLRYAFHFGFKTQSKDTPSILRSAYSNGLLRYATNDRFTQLAHYLVF